MALPPEIEAELDAAYDALNLTVQGMLDEGDDPRAIVGGMGRLYLQMMNEFLSDQERQFMAGALMKAFTQPPN